MLDHCQIPVGCFRGSEGAGLGSASVTGPMSRTSSSDRRHDVGIALVSLAGLLIEIAYTRVVSFKLFYYFTYLVIGLALLGLGTGGVLLAEAGILPDVLHTSLQDRAIHSAELALRAMDRSWIPVHRSWRLNERHYGALQGLDKD